MFDDVDARQKASSTLMSYKSNTEVIWVLMLGTGEQANVWISGDVHALSILPSYKTESEIFQVFLLGTDEHARTDIFFKM